MFINAVLGHFVGDYLLQTKEMALTKSAKTFYGLWMSVLHSSIYTLAVCLFTWKFAPLFVALVFLTHWPIDRWSLGTKWLQMIRGRDILRAYESKEKYHEIDLAFSCLVYAVVDNTLHLVLLWLVINFIPV